MIFKPDFNRIERCGIPEIIYGKSKTIEDLEVSIKAFLSNHGRAIVTKLDAGKAHAVMENFKARELSCAYDRRSEVLVVKKKSFKVKRRGVVGVIAAGMSDAPVAEEARILLEELGCRVIADYDVGIAGLHRLFPALKKMRAASVIIAVAGMEGALPSVVSGLVKVPVIGIPTSVGYGVGQGGIAALCTMLNSCSPVAVVNIDNGYGAAALAYKIAFQHK
jgi:NCAIR mutase (PurE)-related protein